MPQEDLNSFNYLMVITSILLGLAVTTLVSDFGDTIRYPRRISKYSLLLYFWAFSTFLGIVQFWWGSWVNRKSLSENQDLFLYLLYLAVPLVWYLLCSTVLPDMGDWSEKSLDDEGKTGERDNEETEPSNLKDNKEQVDLEEYYFNETKKRTFWLFGLIAVLNMLIGQLIFREHFPKEMRELPDWKHLYRTILLIIFIVLAMEKIKDRKRKKILHACLLAIALAFFTVFIYKFSPSLSFVPKN